MSKNSYAQQIAELKKKNEELTREVINLRSDNIILRGHLNGDGILAAQQVAELRRQRDEALQKLGEMSALATVLLPEIFRYPRGEEGTRVGITVVTDKDENNVLIQSESALLYEPAATVIPRLRAQMAIMISRVPIPNDISGNPEDLQISQADFLNLLARLAYVKHNTPEKYGMEKRREINTMWESVNTKLPLYIKEDFAGRMGHMIRRTFENMERRENSVVLGSEETRQILS